MSKFKQLFKESLNSIIDSFSKHKNVLLFACFTTLFFWFFSIGIQSYEKKAVKQSEEDIVSQIDTFFNHKDTIAYYVHPASQSLEYKEVYYDLDSIPEKTIFSNNPDSTIQIYAFIKRNDGGFMGYHIQPTEASKVGLKDRALHTFIEKFNPISYDSYERFPPPVNSRFHKLALSSFNDKAISIERGLVLFIKDTEDYITIKYKQKPLAIYSLELLDSKLVHYTAISSAITLIFSALISYFLLRFINKKRKEKQ